MAKEKIRELEIKNKELTFIFEIVGLICILISLISLFRFGLIGKYGMLSFKLLFGDWYFIFLIALAFLGVYFLFMHHGIEFRSIRYIGVSLILISLIILSHFSMHNFVIKYEGNCFKNTIFLYLDYFKTAQSEKMIGGGLIGALFFYLFFFLLSKAGTIIICIVLIFVGILFIFKITIVSFFQNLLSFIRKTFGGAFSFTKKFKERLYEYGKEYRLDKNKKLKINDFRDLEIDLASQKKQNEEYLMQIKNAINHLNIFYQDVFYITCLHISVFFIKSFQTINFEVLKITLNKIIKNKFLLRYDKNAQMIVVEILNLIPTKLSLKKALQENDKLIFGCDDRNELIKTNDNVLIISERTVIFENYLTSLFLLEKLKKRHEVYFYDFTNHFSAFSNYIGKYETDLISLKELKNEFDFILDLLEKEGVSTIYEYNKKQKEKIKRPVIFLNGVEKLKEKEEALKNLEFLLLTSSVIGIQIIVCLTKDVKLPFLNQFNYKFFLKNDFSVNVSQGILNLFLKMSENEGILKYQNDIIRFALVGISNDDLNKILNKK